MLMLVLGKILSIIAYAIGAIIGAWIGAKFSLWFFETVDRIQDYWWNKY